MGSPEIAAALLFIFMAAGMAVAMVSVVAGMTWWLRKRGVISRKQGRRDSYECGVPKLGATRLRFSVRFYLIALLFVLFDIETVFLMPYAIACRSLGWVGFMEVFFFVGVLGVGLLYLYRRGALEWD
jgi:NADH-quinone oxidoreductase subunit A